MRHSYSSICVKGSMILSLDIRDGVVARGVEEEDWG